MSGDEAFGILGPEAQLERDAAVSPRGSTATLGLPYPAGTDPVAAGAANFQALAEAVEPKLNFVKISTSIAGAGGVANFDLLSIPQIYTHLRLVLFLRGDTAAANVQCRMRFNNDTGVNYDYPNSNQAFIVLVTTPAASARPNVFVACTLDIPFYTVTNFEKGSHGYQAYSEPVGPSYNQGLASGNWRSTAAINRITLYPSVGNFVQYSRVELLGAF